MLRWLIAERKKKYAKTKEVYARAKQAGRTIRAVGKEMKDATEDDSLIRGLHFGHSFLVKFSLHKIREWNALQESF